MSGCAVSPSAAEVSARSALLGLTTRELNKLRGRCLKWLERFAGFASPLQLTDIAVTIRSGGADSDDEVGLIVLNGGVLTGCSPFDVRELLLDHGIITDNASCPNATEHRQVVFYSSTLPFAVVRSCPRLSSDQGSPLLRWQEDVVQSSQTARKPLKSELHVPSNEQSDDHAPARLAPEASSRQSRPSSQSHQSLADSMASTVLDSLYILPVAREQRVHNSGSSQNDGSGYLLLLPCKVRLVLDRLGNSFQRTVLGIGDLQACKRQHSPPLTDTQSSTLGSDSYAVNCDKANADTKRELQCTSFPEIPGLFKVDDFLTPAEHDSIWSDIQSGRGSLTCEYLSRRRVAHFNRKFLYGVNKVGDEGDDVNARPSYYAWMRDRLQNLDPTVCIRSPYPLAATDRPCDQLTVNFYDNSELSACGIAAHVDAHSAFGDYIFIVSLGSPTVLEYVPFLSVDGSSADPSAMPYGVYVPPRSLVVMSGESRYGWTHCIAERRTDTLCDWLPTQPRGDRVSLTWRHARLREHQKALCPYPALCDGV